MYKIYESGNYFYVEITSGDFAGRIFKGHKKDVLISQLENGGTVFEFVGIYGRWSCDNRIDFSDIVDENDVAFGSVQDFIDFYEEHTGNFNSGGGAASNGPNNRVINYFADNFTDLTTNIALTPVDGEIAMVRGAEGTSWLPYTMGGTYYPKGGYIYDGAQWIPNTDLITQQLELNIDDINGLETDLNNHVIDLLNPHDTTLQQTIEQNPVAQVSQQVVISTDTGGVVFRYSDGTTAGSIVNATGANAGGSSLSSAIVGSGVSAIFVSTNASLGMRVTDTLYSKGLINGGDYEPQFVPRSLVTKQYVDGLVTGTNSGTNTGDETTVTIKTKRPLKTVEGQSLEGTGNIDLNASDVGLSNVDNTSDLNKPISNATQNALDNKVDVVAGKGLSDENYTLVEKSKLAGIDAGAEVNVQSDWNATTGDALILNKPILSNADISDIAISKGSLIQSILTVPTLTATVNNWNPTGFDLQTDLIRVNINANNRAITGIVKPPLGVNRILAIKNLNNAGLDIRFSNNNAGSLPENRFLCRDANSKSIKPNEIALWFYDHIQQRWTPFNRIG